MSVFINSFKIELYQIYRSKLNYLLFLLPILQLSVITKYGFEFYNGSSYLVQSLIIGSMILGHNVFKSEELNSCEDIFKLLDFKYIKFLSKLFAIFFTLSILNIIFIIFPFIAMIFTNESYTMFKEVLKYIILYFWLTSIASSMVGFFIATINLNKISYFIIIVTSISIGAFGKMIFSGLYFVLPYLDTLNKLINLNQFDISQMYNKLYGFDTELARYIHHIIYILILYILIHIIFCIKNSILSKKILISLIIIFIINTICISYFKTPVFLRETGDSLSSAKRAIKYDITEYYHENNEFDILKINANISTKKSLQVDGTFTIKLLKNTDTITGTLYEGFKIITLKCSNKNLTFNQDKNNFTIFFDKEIQKNSTLEIYMKYEGESAQVFYSGNKAVFLPATFPWLPLSSKSPVYYPTYNEPTYLLPENQIEYNINYNGHSNVTSNLTINNNNISGKSKGLTIIAGNFYSFYNGEDRFISSYYKTGKNKIISHQNTIENNINEINKILELESINFKSNFFVDIDYPMTRNNRHGEYIIINDTIISSFYEDLNYSKSDYFKNSLYAILSSNNNINYHDDSFVILFMELFKKWYSKTYNTNYYKEDYSEKQEKMISEFNNKISNLSDKKIKLFFQQYYKILSKKKPCDINEINKIINNLRS